MREFQFISVSSPLRKKKKSESSLIHKIRQPDCIVQCIQNFCQRNIAKQVPLAAILAKFVKTHCKEKILDLRHYEMHLLSF